MKIRFTRQPVDRDNLLGASILTIRLGRPIESETYSKEGCTRDEGLGKLVSFKGWEKSFWGLHIVYHKYADYPQS